MDDLMSQITRCADQAVVLSRGRTNPALDFSEGSLAIVDTMLAEAAQWRAEISADQIESLVQNLGCYVLEVARGRFGGRYQWHDSLNQPVLVVGEPAFRVAMIAWDKVRGRLEGDEGDNIAFLYAGFAAKAQQATPGTDMLFV